MKNVDVTESSNVALKEQVETSTPEAGCSEEIKNEADKVVESIIDNVTKNLADESLSTNGCQEQVESAQDKNSNSGSHLNISADNLGSMEPIEKENLNIEKAFEINKSDEQKEKVIEISKSDVQDEKVIEINKSDVQDEKVLEINKSDMQDEKVLEVSESDVQNEKDTNNIVEKEVVLTEVNGTHSEADILM